MLTGFYNGMWSFIVHHRWSLAKMAVSAGLVFLLMRNIGWSQWLAQFEQAAWRGVVFSLTILVISNLLGALQWFLLLRHKKISVSFGQVLSFYHVGLFFNNFLIGNVGGDALRVFDIRRVCGETSAALSTVIMDRFIGFIAMASLGLFATLLMARKMFAAAAIESIILVFAIWVLAAAFLFHEPLAKKFSWMFRLFLPQSLHVKAKAFYYSLHDFRRKRTFLVRLFGLSLIIQSLRILTHYGAAQALGVRTYVNYFFLFIPIVALVASLPVSLGGLGVREQSAATLFGQVGLPAAQIVAFEFLAYLIGILATLPGGVIFALRREKKTG